MLKNRSYELRLPADWPPASVTVNGKPVPKGDAGKPGWTYAGNSLTTIIPTPSFSTSTRMVVEIRRATGLTARRGELDGFNGSMTRLRAAYDALQQSSPIVVPPDPLVDAMQSGDRLGYHPENAVTEIAHFREMLPKAQAAVHAIQSGFQKSIDEYVKHEAGDAKRPADMDARVQKRIDLMQRALDAVDEAAK
jgi:alpha-glucosidase